MEVREQEIIERMSTLKLKSRGLISRHRKLTDEYDSLTKELRAIRKMQKQRAEQPRLKVASILAFPVNVEPGRSKKAR
jgi:vacuolar-type H+-ATPase subunit D/Vma8